MSSLLKRKHLLAASKGAGSSTLLNGLTSYWKLDEASGNRLDSHGTNHLTPSAPIASAAGKVGNCAEFPSTGWLRCVNNASLQMGDIDYTWSLWVKANSPAYIMDKGNELNFLADPNFTFSIPGGPFAVSSVAGSPTNWSLVVFWREKATGKISIQVNNGAVITSGGSSIPVVNTTPLTVGAIDGIAFYGGWLDEIGFWKRVLTAQERTDLYNGGAGKTYPF